MRVLAGRWGRRDIDDLILPGEVGLVLYVLLRQQCDVVLMDGFGETLAQVQVEGGTWVSLHNVVCDGTEELRRGEVFGSTGLCDDSEGDGGAILISGVIRRRA